jgi:hypothetical protein
MKNILMVVAVIGVAVFIAAAVGGAFKPTRYTLTSDPQ